MRKLLIALVFASAAMMVDVSPAPAGINEKWCAVLQTDDESVSYDCQYATFEACRPHVLAGNRGFCNLNPAYAEPTRKAPQRRDRRN